MCVQENQGDGDLLMNGSDGENFAAASPLTTDAGDDSRSSSPDTSDFVSSFVRNSARKSLGNGLSTQKWIFAQEKVMEHKRVSNPA